MITIEINKYLTLAIAVGVLMLRHHFLHPLCDGCS